MKMSEISEKIRYILQFYFEKGKNATQAREKICRVYGQDALSNATACRWFARFRAGNFNVKDGLRSGRPITEKADEIKKLVELDNRLSSYDIGKQLNIDHKTVLNHLHKAGYTKTLDVWVSQEEFKKAVQTETESKDEKPSCSKRKTELYSPKAKNKETDLWTEDKKFDLPDKHDAIASKNTFENEIVIKRKKIL